jgi:hypothetical protein
MGRPRHSGTTPARRAFGRYHTHLESRPAQRASIWKHAQHRTWLPRTGALHNGLPYHARTTSFQHNRPSYHACTTGFCTTDSAQRAFRKHDSPHPKRTRNGNHAATDAERPPSAAGRGLARVRAPRTNRDKTGPSAARRTFYCCPLQLLGPLYLTYAPLAI